MMSARCGESPATCFRRSGFIVSSHSSSCSTSDTVTDTPCTASEAFIRGDAAAGREVCRRDDRVDALHRSVFRILLTHMMEDAHSISAGMELFLVSRNLERVADLATNIGEDVVFLVEGKSIKHHAEDRGEPANV